MVRMFCVVLAARRRLCVAACTSTPGLIAQVDCQAVELQLGGGLMGRTVAELQTRRTRSKASALAAVVSVSVDRELSIGLPAPASGSSWLITRCGRIGVSSSSCAASMACGSSWNRRSVSASGISGASST